MSSLTRKIQKQQRSRKPTPPVHRAPSAPKASMLDPIVCVGIKRGDQFHGWPTNQFKSHADLRRHLKDETPYERRPGDVEGFYTKSGQFLTRHAAKEWAVRTGQLSPAWRTTSRDVLSSDLW